MDIQEMMHFVSERMGINGCCFQIRMSKQLLNHSYVHSSLVEMRSKCMP